MPEPTPRSGYEIPHRNAPPGVCRWCGEELGALKRDGTPDTRVRWHKACAEAYKLSWPGFVRQRVAERDNGVCRECGLDCEALAELIRRAGHWRQWSVIYRNLGIGSGITQRRDLWDADHITPLVDGGSLDLANIQTLCVWCHRRKTANEASERARRRAASSSQGGLGL